MSARNIELLTSFGIEYEFISPLQSKVARDKQLQKLGFNVVHDASAETKVRYLNEIRIDNQTSLRIHTKTGKAGGELVSTIWFNEPTKILGKLRKMTEILHCLGEPSKTDRCGIHFHFNYAFNLDILKSIIILSAHLEKMFYTLGGMGYMNRGVSNDAIYFRPITRKGPICVPTQDGGWAQSFTVESLLEAENSEDFFIRYGDSYNIGVGNRYFPTRYHWINLTNLIDRKNTLEVRVFNTTLDPLTIWTALQFSSWFAKCCLTHNANLLIANGLHEENSIFDEQGKDYIIETAENFCTSLNVDGKVTSLVLGVLDVSPEPTFEEYYVRSHLHDRSNVRPHWCGTKYQPKAIPGKQVKKPKYEDYYNSPNSPEGGEIEMPTIGGEEPRPLFSQRMEELREVQRSGQARRRTRPFGSPPPSLNETEGQPAITVNASNWRVASSDGNFNNVTFEEQIIESLDLESPLEEVEEEE